mgnify:CR=1 FL=1
MRIIEHGVDLVVSIVNQLFNESLKIYPTSLQTKAEILVCRHFLIQCMFLIGWLTLEIKCVSSLKCRMCDVSSVWAVVACADSVSLWLQAHLNWVYVHIVIVKLKPKVSLSGLGPYVYEHSQPNQITYSVICIWYRYLCSYQKLWAEVFYGIEHYNM